MRVFIAINLPNEVKDKIEEIQTELKESGLFEGKMTEIQNIHLTLKFLGEIDDKTLEEVTNKLKEIDWSKFEVEIDYAGVFDERFLRIIWLHLKNAENLQKKIDLELVDLFNMEKRFMSHITISRIKKVKDKQKLLERIKNFKFKDFKFKVNSFYLMESKLSGAGPTYKILREYGANK